MQPMVDHLPLDAAHLHPITSDEAGQAGIDDITHEKRPHQIIAIWRKDQIATGIGRSSATGFVIGAGGVGNTHGHEVHSAYLGGIADPEGAAVNAGISGGGRRRQTKEVQCQRATELGMRLSHARSRCPWRATFQDVYAKAPLRRICSTAFSLEQLDKNDRQRYQGETGSGENGPSRCRKNDHDGPYFAIENKSRQYDRTDGN